MTKLTLKKKVKSFILQAQLAVQYGHWCKEPSDGGFSEQDIFERLLSLDIEKINLYLMEMELLIGRRTKALDFVKRGELYLVYAEHEEPELYLCFLGEDLRDPDIYVPSVSQLHEAREWHIAQDTQESAWCSSTDTWLEHNLKLSFFRLENYSRILSSLILTWKDVYAEEGKGLQTRLAHQYLEMYRKLQTEITLLKKKQAPEFMVNECAASILRTKNIIKRLQRVTSYE